MSKTPYAKFQGNDLILRDELAIDRTLLANERTLLAYLRSSLALAIAGASIVHFAQSVWFAGVGIACFPVGLLSAAVGIRRYRVMNNSIYRMRQAGNPKVG